MMTRRVTTHSEAAACYDLITCRLSLAYANSTSQFEPSCLMPPSPLTLYFLFIQLFIRWFMGPLPLPSGNTELRWFPTRADKRLNYWVSYLNVLAYTRAEFLEQFAFISLGVSISSLQLLPCPTSIVYPVHKRVHHKRSRYAMHILYVCVHLIAFSLHLVVVRLIDGMFVFLMLICWTFILSRQYVGCSICLYNLVATQVCFYIKKYTVSKFSWSYCCVFTVLVTHLLIN